MPDERSSSSPDVPVELPSDDDECIAAESAGFDVGGSTHKSRTIYVENLHISIVDVFLVAYFGEIDEVVKVKINYNDGKPNAFIQFSKDTAPHEAVLKYNETTMLDQEIKVRVLEKFNSEKSEEPEVFHIFIGDLTTEVSNDELRKAFSPYGEVLDAKVIIDPITQKSRGYGFVAYGNKMEAEQAIVGMNGTWLGSRQIRTNWANRRADIVDMPHRKVECNYAEVYDLVGPENRTVYIGNLDDSATESELSSRFERFGVIAEMRIIRSKGCGFITYDNKDSACNAIVEMNYKTLFGRIIRCSWAKYAKNWTLAEESTSKTMDFSRSL